MLTVVEKLVSVEVRGNRVVDDAFEKPTQNERKANWLLVIGEYFLTCLEDMSYLSAPPFIRNNACVQGIVQEVRKGCRENGGEESKEA